MARTNAYQMGLAELSEYINHLKGNTATTLTKPTDRAVTYLVLDSEVGDFRARKGSYAALGSELVTNGAMATDTGWTKGTGWTIAGGVADSDASQAGDSDLEQTISGLVPGYTYTVAFTVANRTAGTVKAVLGGTAGTTRSTDATFTENIIAGSDGTIKIRADLDFDGTVDDVSVKTAVMTFVDPPAATQVSGGSLKIREDKPIVITAPEAITVIGSSSSDILTYYWA